MLRFLTLRRTFAIVLFLGLLAFCARPATDPDIWWHLSTGRLIVESRSIPHTDPFSYTRAGAPWVAHEWLADVLLFEVNRMVGASGLIVLFAGVTTLAFGFLYLRCDGRPYVAGVFLLLAAFALSPVIGVRPQMISFLLTSFLLWRLERSRPGSGDLWAIPPIFVLWANLHAGFALGIAILLVFTIAAWFAPSRNGESRWRLSAVSVLSIVAVALNPNGTRLYWYPIEALRSVRMQNQIAEWLSPDFHQPAYVPFLVMTLLVFAGVALSRWKPGGRDLVLLLASLYAALHSIRHIAIFVLIAVPMLVRLALSLIQPSSSGASTHRLRPAIGWMNPVIVALALLFAGWKVTRVAQFQELAVRSLYPSRAVDFLASHPAASRVFGLYDWGGYLIWRLYPSQQVFIDGRADVYGDAVLKRFADTYSLRHNWKEGLAGACTVVIPPVAPLAVGLRQDPTWLPAYSDPQAVVFRKAATPDLGEPGRCPPLSENSPAFAMKRR